MSLSQLIYAWEQRESHFRKRSSIEWGLGENNFWGLYLVIYISRQETLGWCRIENDAEHPEKQELNGQKPARSDVKETRISYSVPDQLCVCVGAALGNTGLHTRLGHAWKHSTRGRPSSKRPTRHRLGPNVPQSGHTRTRTPPKRADYELNTQNTRQLINTATDTLSLRSAKKINGEITLNKTKRKLEAKPAPKENWDTKEKV